MDQESERSCTVGVLKWNDTVIKSLYFRDDPSLHPTVTDTELEKIRRGKSEAEKKLDIKTPYKVSADITTSWKE